MRGMTAIGCLLACLLACATTSAMAADATWRLVSDKNGIKVYRQDDDQARIKTFRGVTRFPLPNPAAIEGLLNDYPAIPRWMHFISSVTEVSRKHYRERTMRFTTELPWPLSDRDVVARFTVNQVADTRTLITAVDDPTAARTPDFVRIPDLNGRLEFQFFPATKEVEATYEVVMDPGGYVPGWAANIVLKDTPYFTLLKLRRILNEPKYMNFQSDQFKFLW